MGGVTSQTSPQPKNTLNNSQPRLDLSVSNPQQIDDTDIYILDDLKNISLFENDKHLKWIDPRMGTEENQRALQFLNNFFNVEGYQLFDQMTMSMQNIQDRKVKVICSASLKNQQYQAMQRMVKISSIYLFCQNKQRAKSLIHSFSKIIQAKFDIVQLKDYILQQIESEQIISKNNLLFFTQDEMNLMNTYKINFHSLIQSTSNRKSMADFINFCKKFYPNNMSQINYFNSNYKLNGDFDQSTRQCLAWLGKQSFYWKSTQTLPKITTDPKKLAYLRFPIKQSFEAIKVQYKRSQYSLLQCFILLQITPGQLKRMKKNINNFLIFTTFIKGYSKQKTAKEAFKKNPKAIFIRVLLKLPPIIDNNLDFGYVINSSQEADIIFNIYNVFEILQQEEDKHFILQYGPLATINYLRQKQRATKLTVNQAKLLRNIDYLQQITSKIDNQAPVLQMSGYFKDSLQIHDRKLQGIRKTQVQSDIEKQIIQLGDAYRCNQQFDKAQQQYSLVTSRTMSLIADVHLAELYIKAKQYVKLDKIIRKIESNIVIYRTIRMEYYFKAYNYVGVQIMNKGEFREASRLFKRLISEINDYYKQRMEGIPLVRQIYRNKATCQINIGNYDQALNLLDTITEWQKVCQGNKSPGLYLTEGLRKTAFQYKGQKDNAIESQKQMQRIRRVMPRQQTIYESRTKYFIDQRQLLPIEQSNVHIDISFNP